jgi:hypothetical protein
MSAKPKVKRLHQLFKDADIIRCVIHGENVCGYTDMGAERDWRLDSDGYYEIIIEKASGEGTDTICFPVEYFNEAFKEESVWILTDSKGLSANVEFYKLTAI